MAERYEVIKTLIRGKQSVRKTETQKGIRVTAHKKPVGYALRDTKNDEIRLVTHLEAIEMVIKSGSTNAQITVTERANGKIVPYIRSKAGVENFQSENMIEEPLVYAEQNPNAKISPKMNEILENYRSRGTTVSSDAEGNTKLVKKEEEQNATTKEKYSKQELLQIVEELKTKA